MLLDKLHNKLGHKSSTRGRAGSKTQSRSTKRQTPLQQAVEQELLRYFELLDGQAPHELHRLVMCQVESTLIDFVMEECGQNQSRAAEYLGISRGTLRNKLNSQ